MSETQTQTDVLVVGAGPTGLTLAGELLRRGLTVRVVDSADGPTEFSKAIAVHARSLEILDDLGVCDALLAKGQKIHGVTMWSGGTAITRADFSELDTRFPYVLAVPQRDTETVLGELLTRRGGSVERKTELVSLRQDGTGVTATLKRGDETLTARAAWLVGCDGAHSAVRKALDLPFEGSTYEERFLLADVKIAWDTRDDWITTYFADDGMVACFPMRDGRWRLIATAPVGDDRADAPTLDEVQALFAARTGTSGALSDMVWSTRFKIHCRQVARYRDDRVMLAGDAAHIHSPAGGQGMNTGIQDAHNLAWKLAMVHQGDARDALLGTYHDERHAVGQAVLKGSDVATKVGTLRGSVARSMRDEVARLLTGFEVIQQRVAREVAELTVSYERGALSVEDTTGVLQARIGTAAGGETPTLSSIRGFEAAPAAGQRARDGKVTVAGESGTRALFAHLDPRAWQVLLFDGRAASPEGYQRFASIASALTARYGDLVGVSVVVPRATRPAELPDAIPVLLDADGELERLYGAVTECVYALRPDRYVGYRAQPVDEAKLLAYFRAFLRARA